MTCPVQTSVAAYALGTLDAADAESLARHLAECASCAAALESFRALPGLLAAVTPADLYQATHRSDDLLLDRLLARAVRERHRQRVLVAAAAAALVAVAGTGAGIGIALHGSDTQTGREIAAQSGSVHARLWLQPAAKETGLTLELSGVAPDQRCQLVAVDRAGHRSTAATWEATYSGVATIHASTATPVSELRSFVVETPAHQRLVTLVVRQ